MKNKCNSSKRSCKNSTGSTLYKKYFDTVVVIESLFRTVIEFPPFPPVEIEFTKSGSGFFIDKYGLIISATHIVRDNSIFDEENNQYLLPEEIHVAVYNVNDTGKNKTFQAEFIGFDGAGDVAVLRIKSGLYNQNFLTWGNSRKTVPGNEVFTIGYPFGEDVLSISQGVVRDNTFVSFRPDTNRIAIESVLEDGANWPGDSGCPVLDSGGSVIGVLSFGFFQAGIEEDSVAGSISQFMAEKISKKILKTKSNYVKGFLGITCSGLFPLDIVQLNIPDREMLGLKIEDILPGGPSDIAGLLIGDVIQFIDGKSVGNIEGQLDVTQVTWFKKPKDKVKLKIIRGGSSITKTVTLGEYPPIYDKFFAEYY